MLPDVLNPGCRIELELPAAFAEEKLDGTKVSFFDCQVFLKFVSCKLFEMSSRVLKRWVRIFA